MTREEEEKLAWDAHFQLLINKEESDKLTQKEVVNLTIYKNGKGVYNT